MRDENKTKAQLIDELVGLRQKLKAQLIDELVELRQKLAELEAIETERKQTEEALKESENRFSTFMEYLPANITIKDHESKFLFGNKHMRDLFDTDNWVGKTAREYFPPEIAERVLSTDYQVLKQGPIVFEEAVPTKTGEIRILETRKFLIKQKGKPDLIGAISLDITERKRAEEALVEERNLLRTLIDNLPDYIYFKDTNSRFVIGNIAVTQIMGATSPDELIGKTDFDFYPQELAAQYYADEQEVIQSGQPQFNREEPVIEPSGNKTWILTTQVPLRDSHGKVVGLVGIGRDITERKQAEEALRSSEELFRATIESTTDGILVVNEDGQVIYSNARFADMWSIPEKLIKTRDDRKLLDYVLNQLIEPQVFLSKVQELYQTSKKDFDTLYFTDGRIFERFSCPLIREGKIAGRVWSFRDITERKRVEEALRKAHDELEVRVKKRTTELSKANVELARTSRLKDEFLANMSHELRTPLSVILGMSESLQEEVYGALNDRQIKSLHMIEESGRHLLSLINDVLDLSKISTGKLELEIAPVSVESICQVSLRFIKQLAQKKRLKVSSMSDSHVTTIYVDGRRLKQILVNLLSNAVKFTPEGGKIGLEVEGDTDQQAVHFTVWDTGIGIAQEGMKRLFQPFVQLDASLSRKYGGTGLGLSLVYRMVEMHGGSVSVESEVGKGSRFRVSLPWQGSGKREIGSLGDRESKEIASQPPISPSSHLPSSPSPQSTMILIAEDHEATVTTLLEYFTDKGHRVMIARNGWEALAYTREAYFDLIVIDIQMPEMDGLEAIRHIRSDKHGKSIPIIALTALAMPGDREKCLAAGADEYFSKPVSLRGLSEAMERFLSRKK